MKKLLLILFMSILGLIGFSSANFTLSGVVKNQGVYANYYSIMSFPYSGNFTTYATNFTCYLKVLDSNSNVPSNLRLYYFYSSQGLGNTTINGNYVNGQWVFTFDSSNFSNFGNPFVLSYFNSAGVSYNFSWSCDIVGEFQNGINFPVCQECQSCDYSSYESQIDNLNSSLSSCNSSYNTCITDYGNCSSSLNYCYYDLGNCKAGVCSGDISTNLFINNIQYPINSNLFINVPTEFDYVYSITGNDSSIDIEYKVDSEYIEGIIDIQNTKPTKDNLNQIVSGLIPLFVPGLVIIMFIYFVFKLLKKIF